eukprot:1077535-Amphidinium_carterae.2
MIICKELHSLVFEKSERELALNVHVCSGVCQSSDVSYLSCEGEAVFLLQKREDSRHFQVSKVKCKPAAIGGLQQLPQGSVPR